jgi:hypothetical protein
VVVGGFLVTLEEKNWRGRNSSRFLSDIAGFARGDRYGGPIQAL